MPAGTYLGDVWPAQLEPRGALEALLATGLVELRHDGHQHVPVCVWPPDAANAIVVTQPGGGKTNLLRVVGHQRVDQHQALPPDRRGIILIGDGKEVGSFYLFEHVPGVQFVNDRHQVAELVGEVRAEVDRRRRRLARARRETVRDPQHQARWWWQPLRPVDLWIDDYLGWLLLLPEDTVKQVLADLAVIAFQGREVKVRLLLTMQTAHAKTLDVGLPPQIKMSCDLRVGVPGRKGFNQVQAGMLYDDRTAKDRIPRVDGGGIVAVGGTQVQVTVPDFPDPSDPEATLPPEERARLWKLLAA